MEPAKAAHALLVQCHVDLQDVRSTKLQACMKSAKPTHLKRELERTIETIQTSDLAQSGRPQLAADR